jgi:arsenate reductase (thioredoxin)
MTEIKKKVLFLCTGNSARSQIAEGLMKSMGGEQWEVKSAGILASYLHPLAIRVMDEVGIDISKQTSKSQSQFLTEEFDYIITLCDHAAMACPNFPGQENRLHWSIEDPAMAIGKMDERAMVFRRTRDEIRARIGRFLRSQP